MNWKILVFSGLIFHAGAIAQVPIEQKTSSNYQHYFDKGESLFEARNYSEALINYNEALILNPYHTESYYARAVTREKLDDPEAALVDYNIYLELKPDQYDALFNRGLLLYTLKKWPQAKQDFTRLLKLPHGETSMVYFRQDRFSSSIDQVFTTQGSDNANVYNYLGLTELELKEFAAALVHFDSAISHHPSDADYHVNKGKCLKALGEPEKAKAAYQAALDINQDHSVAKHNLSILSRDNGSREEAEQLLDEVITKNPNLPFPYAERAFYKMNQGDLNQALEDYNKAIELSPKTAEYWLNRGMVKEKMSNWVGAYDDYSQAITLDENLEKAWFGRGNLLYKRGRYNDAIKDYDVAIVVHESYGLAYYNRALAKNKMGNNSEACGDLKKAQRSGFEVQLRVMNGICGVQ